MFDSNACIVTTLTGRPVDYVIKHIEAHKHVLLWYFFRKELYKATHTVRQSDENDALTITKAEEGQVIIWSASFENAKLDH